VFKSSQHPDAAWFIAIVALVLAFISMFQVIVLSHKKLVTNEVVLAPAAAAAAAAPVAAQV
jgi:hypothetical protein